MKNLDSRTDMQKAADAADISVLFFSAGANFWAILGHFWAILGHFWAILAILGHFWVNLGNFGSFLACFTQKLATTGRHGRHVFATLVLNTVMLRMVMDGDFLCHNHCSLQRLSRESRVEHNIGASLHTDCKPPGIAWGQRSKKEPDKDLKRKTDPIYPGRLRAPRHSARF